MQKYPIVILPGWLLSAKRFAGLANEFKKEGYETHVVDFPGFEFSAKLTKIFNLTDYVKFLRSFLKQKRVSRAIFVAHSFGGRVALKLLSQEPKLAHALILSGTPGFPNISKFRRKLMRFIAKTGAFLSYIPPFLFFRPLLKKTLYRAAGSIDYLKLDGYVKKTFEIIVDETLEEYMKKIRVPTLLVWGDKDRLVSKKIAKRMQQTIKHSTLTILPELGHMFTYREPKLMASKVLEFLATL